MVKGKASSINLPNHDAISAENKSNSVYIVISKSKVKISLTSCNFGNGHVLSTERFNASWFYARTRKKQCGTKHYEIKTANRRPKIARIPTLEIRNE